MRVKIMRNIETFPWKQMYPYLSLVEREFYHNIDRRRWLVWRLSRTWNIISIRIWHQLWPCRVDIALLGLCIAVAHDREAGYWEYSLNIWEYSLMEWPPSVASFLKKSSTAKRLVCIEVHWRNCDSHLSLYKSFWMKMFTFNDSCFSQRFGIPQL